MTTSSRPDPAATRPEHGRDELLSSLVDGEGSQQGLDALCHRWRSDDDLRADWHLYHLIGDTLRSDELAGPAARDRAMLQRLRDRLATEPVPLAPAPLALRPRARRWLAPAAMVAGVVAVGVATVTLRSETGAGPSGWNKQPLAVAPAVNGAAPVHRVGSASTPAAAGRPLVLDRQLMRDARLDAYFEAHRGAIGSTPSTVPAGALRSVEILVPQR